MSLGTLILLVGLVLAILTIFVATPVWLLAVAVVCVAVGVLVGAAPLIK